VLKELPELLKDEKTALPEKQGAFAILAGHAVGRTSDKLLDEWLDRALAGKVPPEIVLDVLDAAETRANAPRLKLYASLKAEGGPSTARRAGEAAGQARSPYLESLAGGDAERGRDIFLNNSAVYCQRCHKLDGQGGEVGPQLNGIAADPEKDRRYMLESIVLPSAKIANGYETVILLLERRADRLGRHQERGQERDSPRHGGEQGDRRSQ
jgi:quinoprotein glucose dehydrogenase